MCGGMMELSDCEIDRYGNITVDVDSCEGCLEGASDDGYEKGRKDAEQEG